MVVVMQLGVYGVLNNCVNIGMRQRVQFLWQGAYVVTGKCLALDDDFVPLLRGPIEACHQKMQVCGQCLHDSNFVGLSANDLGHGFVGLVVYIYPRCRRGIIQGLEVSVDAFGCPSVEILLNERSGTLWLKTQRVSAKIGTWYRTRLSSVFCRGLAIRSVYDISLL